MKNEGGAGPPAVAAALEHLTGPSRGTVTEFSASALDISLSPGRLIQVSEALPGEPRDDLVARLHRAENTYEIEAPEGLPVWVNGNRVAAMRLQNGAIIEFGVTGPISRFRVYGEGVTVRKTVTDIVSDCVTYLKVSRQPVANRMFRVRPETLCRITEFSEHESNGRELDEGERVAVEVLPVLGQSAAAVEPGDGAFDHPTPGLDDEALHPIGSLDDLGLEIGQDAGQGAVKDRPLIGAVGEQFPEKGKQTEQGRQQRETAGAILNVGGGDDAVQQQALRIDQNMPLLALDQLAGIEAVAVDASPPFSALFTL